MCDINIATGEVTQFAFDVRLPGRLRLLLKRRYSSRTLRPGPVGIGWNLNLGQSMKADQDGLHLVSPGEPSVTLRRRDAKANESGFRVERRGEHIAVIDARQLTRLFVPVGDT